jgi:hypothetical protein
MISPGRPVRLGFGCVPLPPTQQRLSSTIAAQAQDRTTIIHEFCTWTSKIHKPVIRNSRRRQENVTTSRIFRRTDRRRPPNWALKSPQRRKCLKMQTPMRDDVAPSVHSAKAVSPHLCPPTDRASRAESSLADGITGVLHGSLASFYHI